MKVALTGATGFIGSHVLTELQKDGHEVTALVRDDAQADIIAARRLAGPWKDKSGDRSTVVGASGRHG
ncbi:MAG TPA: NAD(P)H-binding protein [Streptosporangiaceae bacterium]|nr:NAD(P)H-binding protein [Streptosporangiaceae bacterium]